MKIGKTILTFAFVSILFALHGQLNFIEGPREVCLGGCADYFTQSPNGSLQDVELVAIFDGDTLNTCSTVSSNVIDQVFTVCYFCEGSYTLMLFSSGKVLDSLKVYVYPFTDSQIMVEKADSCVVTPGYNQTVCGGTTHTYLTIPQIPNQLTTFNVINAKSFVVLGNKVNITWNESGDGRIIATTASTFGACITTNEYLVKILASLEIDFNTNGNIFCAGEVIIPEPDITDAVYYEWDFGNGEKSNDIKPTISYDAPGTYLITLLVKNACGCSGTVSKEVTIKDKFKPVIDCQSTICENTTMTYTTTADCSNFNWKVSSNGKVAQGGASSDKSITIDWGKGPQGIIELEVASCNFDLCPEKAIFEIPIISENAAITGEVVACQGALEYYEIQKYGATDYQWTIEGGNIVSGQGKHGIIVEWTASSSGKLSVAYNNCYLKCGGSDVLEVLIRPDYKLIIDGNEWCEGDKMTARTLDLFSLPVFVNQWKITDENGNILYSENNKSNIEYIVAQGVKKMTITSKATDLCHGVQSVNAAVLEKSKAVKGIQGEIAICKNITYTYSAEKNITSAEYEWTIKDGSSTKTMRGERVNVQWTSAGPYIILLQQTDLSGNYCLSNPIELKVKPIDKFDFTGKDESCLYDEYIIKATYYEGIDYNWTILPKEAATIIKTDAETLTVVWNKPGLHTVQLSNCAETFSKKILINDLPQFTINHPQTQCENISTIVNTNTTFVNYLWRDSTENVVSTIADPSLLPSTYTCEVTDLKGCINKEAFTIKSLPKPNIFISTPENESVCLSSSIITWPKIYALDAEDGYKYQWLRNGTTIASTANIHVTDVIGQYQVEVTDAFGCKNISNYLTIYDNCDPSGGGGGGGGGGTASCTSTIGTVDFNYSNTECHDFKFISTAASIIAGSEEWNFGDVQSGADNYQTGSIAVHRFSNAGYYKVYHSVKVDDSANPGGQCIKYTFKAVEVPVRSNFEFVNACQGELIQFYDRSTFIPGYDITTWNWEFDDPTSGAANVSTVPDPTHIFAKDGTYNVKLTVSNGTCSDTYILQITLHPQLSPSIIDSDARCENETTKFELADLKEVLSIYWNFGDAASADANIQDKVVAFHRYELPDTYTITANIKSIFGCNSVVSHSVDVVPNSLQGNILSGGGNILCDGQTTQLSFSDPVATWQWSTEEKTSTIDVKQTGTYKLTVTDFFGCTYIPQSSDVIFNPLPQTSLVSYISQEDVMYNDYDKNLEYCSGFDLKIQAVENSDWVYQWSGAGASSASSINLLQLAPSDYALSLSLKDKNTQCISVIPDIKIKVNGLPNGIAISASTLGQLCEGTSHVLQVVNPTTGIAYKWSNGQKGKSTTTKLAGNYFVIAKDNNGCEGKSNTLEVLSGPDINLIPSGCFDRCAPDSICYPSINNVVTYQWYKENVAMTTAQGGQAPYPIFTMSGSYHVVMVGSNGCVNQSYPLNLTLKSPVGVIMGKVYIDKNKDGVIDSGDSIAQGLKVNIMGYSSTTNAIGQYTFSNIPGGQYTVSLDPSTIPAGFEALLNNLEAKIKTCDDTVFVNCLLGFNCAPQVDGATYILCSEKEINIDNITFKSDTTYTQLIAKPGGCVDTIIHDITFARKLNYDFSYKPSCPQTSSGEATITPLEGSIFTATIDGNAVVNTTFYNLSIGKHTLTLKDDLGCSSSQEFTIEAKPEVQFDVQSEAISCAKGYADVSLTLINHTVDEVSIKWSNGNQNNTLKIESEGQFNVAVDNGCGAIEKTFKIEKEKGKNTINKFIACDGVAMNLLDQKFSQDTLFTLTKQAGFCIDTNTYDLRFSKTFEYDLKVVGNCKNEDNGVISLNMKSTGQFKYLLSGQEIQFINGMITDLSPKRYELKIKDAIGCEAKEIIDIKTKEAVEYNLVDEDISCYKDYAAIGLELVNYSPEDLTILWSNNSTDIVSKVDIEGSYTIQVDNGCETFSKTFEVGRTDVKPSFVLPNVLAPEGSSDNAQIDLNNTSFVNANIKSFHIYDRSGARVFNSTIDQKIWDGSLGGRLLSSGVYIYTIEAEFDVCGKFETIRKSGTITIIR